MPLPLTPLQRLALFGVLRPRPYLHWCHIAAGEVTLDACVAADVDAAAIHERVQPALQPWLELPVELRPQGRHVTYMLPWLLHPLRDLGLSFSDVVFLRLPVHVMLALGLDFRVMRDEHGLHPDALHLFRYTWRDWVALGITQDFTRELGPVVLRERFGVSLECALSTSLPS